MRMEAPKGPLIRLLWKEKATEAVLAFLRDTKVECMVTMRPRKRKEKTAREKAGRAHRIMFFLCSITFAPCFCPFLLEAMGGEANYDRLCRSRTG